MFATRELQSSLGCPQHVMRNEVSVKLEKIRVVWELRAGGRVASCRLSIHR